MVWEVISWLGYYEFLRNKSPWLGSLPGVGMQLDGLLSSESQVMSPPNIDLFKTSLATKKESCGGRLGGSSG